MKSRAIIQAAGAVLALIGFALLWGHEARAQQSVRPCYYDSSGQCVFVSSTNPLPTTSSGGGGGLSVTDQTVWVQGTSAFTPTGGVFNDSATLSSGQEGTVRLTTKRAMIVDTDTTGNALYSALTASIPAGTNLIGDVNLRQGGTALSTTNGIYSNLLQGNAVLSATNGTYANILQGNAVLSTTNPVFSQAIPGTTGGLSVYFVQPAASDNHAVIKAGAGQVYKVSVTNNSATVNYLRLYNATTGFNGCNSATNLVYQMAIPASTSVGGLSDSWEAGIAFSTGISICVTSGYATTDTTNATASAMSVNIGYK